MGIDLPREASRVLSAFPANPMALYSETRYKGFPFLPEYVREHSSMYQLESHDRRVEGHKCYSLRWMGHDEMIVCPDLGWSIVERKIWRSPGGKPRVVFKMKDFFHPAQDVWLPRIIEEKEYLYDNDIVPPLRGQSENNIRDVRVLRIDRAEYSGLDEALFEISAPKGYQVIDDIRNLTYWAGESAESPFSEEILSARRALARRSWNKWILGSLIGIGCIAAGVWYYRRAVTQ
jgi:hypothetical protein